nr:hypothetical protein [Actinomycetales bacterium]
MLALLAAVVLLALLVYLLLLLVRPPRRAGAPARPRWEVDTVMENGWTLVIVRKVTTGPDGPVELTRQTVAAIPDDDPNWSERYKAALAEARDRASTLELES